MVTLSAFLILAYCVLVLALAAVLAGLGLRWRRLRPLAVRLVAVFGVFALAAAYVWLDLGPKVDARADPAAPQPARPEPRELDV